MITVGAFHAGTAPNIIAPRAELRGTIRALDSKVQDFLHERIREITTRVAEAARATADVRITRMYPVTVNNDDMAAFARGVAERVVAPEGVTTDRPTMGAEDMSFFLNAAPGCFIFVGSANAERKLNAPHHSPLFDFDEAALPIGAGLLCELATSYLSAGSESGSAKTSATTQRRGKAAAR